MRLAASLLLLQPFISVNLFYVSWKLSIY